MSTKLQLIFSINSSNTCPGTPFFHGNSKSAIIIVLALLKNKLFNFKVLPPPKRGSFGFSTWVGSGLIKKNKD